MTNVALPQRSGLTASSFLRRLPTPTMMHVFQARSLLFDVYAPIVRYAGGWFAIADLITLLGDLDMEEQAVRSSVSRLRAKGMLERQVHSDFVGYALTDHALKILAEGDSRIYGSLEPATLEDGWALLTFSVPEKSRSDRHQLRRRLTWLGFGNLGAGVWIAPRRVLERTIEMVDEVGLGSYIDIFTAHYAAFDDLERLVARCWDIERMRELYSVYCREFAPMVRRWERTDPAAEPKQAFADFVAAMHEWRQMPYLDPGLPAELLPADWEGTAAAHIFNRIHEILLSTSQSYVASVRSV
ncbi:PaaX family transcriptional regulator C-terminal domain-containing protein [soil metagenome]